MRVHSNRSRLRLCVDALIAVLLWCVWLAAVLWLTSGRRVVLWDTFRDLAWAENIRTGRVWSDPTHLGATWWYPPGSPLLIAGLSRLTGWSVADLYGYSALWLSGWLPVLLYLVLRQASDRTTALVGLGTVFVGSFTWLTHAAAAIPSFQGLVFNLLGLLCWQRCCRCAAERCRTPWTWVLASGVLLAGSAWFHPLCAALLAAAVFCHGLLALWSPQLLDDCRRSVAPRCAVYVIGVGFCLSAPLGWHLLRVHAQSPALTRFFADELMDPTYYAQALAPLIVPAALAGVWHIVRRQADLLWAVGYAFVGLLGLAAGYLAQSPGWELPFLLPHEFLWHAQLGLGICAAVGLIALARRWGDHAGQPRRMRWRYMVALMVLLGVVVGPGLRGLPQAGKYLIELEPFLSHTAELRAWIRANTALEDVFVCPPDVGYCVIAALTGRKCVVVWPMHSNPALDFQTRHDDVRTMLDTSEPGVLVELARRYRARYLALATPPTDARPVVSHRCADHAVLQTVFRSNDGSAIVYRINCDTAEHP